MLNSRLYRESHPTFDAYCRERWGWTADHARRQIQAAEVAGILLPIGSIPATESQARELVPLLREGEQEVIEVWSDANSLHAAMKAAPLLEASRRRWASTARSPS